MSLFFSSHADPLFNHLQRRSSFSIDPADPLAPASTLSVESSLRPSHYSRGSNYLLFDNFSMGQSLDLPAESFDDPSLAGSHLFRPGRSFSEIDMTSLPDTDASLGDLSLRSPVAFPSRDACFATPPRSRADDAHRPLLAKRNSIGSLGHAAVPQESPVVKGSINFPARNRQGAEEPAKTSPRARSVPPPKDPHVAPRVNPKDFGE